MRNFGRGISSRQKWKHSRLTALLQEFFRFGMSLTLPNLLAQPQLTVVNCKGQCYYLQWLALTITFLGSLLRHLKEGECQCC